MINPWLDYRVLQSERKIQQQLSSIPEEIQSYVQLGLSPLEAIRAATIVPATLMGAAKESGSIEKGKTGDLLILDENPLLNIGTLNKIRTIVRGQFVIHKWVVS
jgi:imidazolonepropionase-like amidohydrolase